MKLRLSMNLEQKHPPSPRRTRKLYEQISKLEGLLAYAVQHDEVVEAARIREALMRLVEEVE